MLRPPKYKQEHNPVIGPRTLLCCGPLWDQLWLSPAWLTLKKWNWKQATSFQISPPWRCGIENSWHHFGSHLPKDAVNPSLHCWSLGGDELVVGDLQVFQKTLRLRCLGNQHQVAGIVWVTEGEWGNIQCVSQNLLYVCPVIKENEKHVFNCCNKLKRWSILTVLTF